MKPRKNVNCEEIHDNYYDFTIKGEPHPWNIWVDSSSTASFFMNSLSFRLARAECRP